MKRSYSQLQTYEKCPRQYEFAYVKKLPRGGISAGESFGTSMHNTLKKWGEREIYNAQLIMKNTADQLHLFMEEESSQDIQELTVDVLLQFWHQSFVVEGYSSRVDADEARRRGERILQLYFDWWQQHHQPVLIVEKGFTLQFGDLQLTGRFDRVEEGADGIHVIDYKTSKPRTQQQVDEDLQLSIYAIACQEVFGKPCSSLSFLFLNENEISPVQTQRSTQELAQASQIIQQLDQHILDAMFAPTPADSTCAHCPYRNVCDAAIL